MIPSQLDREWEGGCDDFGKVLKIMRRYSIFCIWPQIRGGRCRTTLGLRYALPEAEAKSDLHYAHQGPEQPEVQRVLRGGFAIL